MLVLTTSTLAIEKNEEAILVNSKELKWVTCIQYFIAFLGGVTKDSLALDL